MPTTEKILQRTRIDCGDYLIEFVDTAVVARSYGYVEQAYEEGRKDPEEWEPDEYTLSIYRRIQRREKQKLYDSHPSSSIGEHPHNWYARWGASTMYSESVTEPKTLIDDI